MYNATDSMSIFDENSAVASFNEKYMLEGTTKEDQVAKVIFRGYIIMPRLLRSLYL